MSRFSSLSFVVGALGLGLLCGCEVPVNLPGHADSSPVSSGALETHYSPTENLEHYDLALLRSAHKSIDLCGFSFTDEAVGDAITSAARRGVRVRVYLDRSQSDDELERAAKHDGAPRPTARKRDVQFADGFFDEQDVPDATTEAVIARLAATPNVEVRIKHSRVLMHLKSYAVDGQTLRSGSANFSPSALKRQDNDLVLTRDAASVRRFELDFNQLWARPDNEHLQPQS
ncbi:MAG TPA: phospholipase D-like domain-containing protein [Acidobacteriaceae bacterium]|nr:phospholipase D-like domain-containing protein [Acidobacteriaceae bacterium]